MNALREGLYGPDDFAGDEVGSPDAMRHGYTLVSQAAGIALVCSLALDSIAYDGANGGRAAEASAAASRLMFKCHGDLAEAARLAG